MNLAFYRTCNVLGRGLAAGLARVEVSGRSNVPTDGPLIAVSNHLNNVDAVLLAIFVPRPIHFLTKIEMFQIPVIGTLAEWYGGVPVHRGQADRAAIERTVALLRAGEVVGIFPEGTRGRTRQLQAPKPGLSLIAARSGASILPIGISGSENARGLAMVWERPRIQIRIGEPFSLPVRRGRGGHQAFTDQVMSRIARLLPDQYRGVYRDHPPEGPAPAVSEVRGSQ